MLFAFDDESLPGVSGLHLEMQRPEKHPGNPIVARGRNGEPDAQRAQCVAVLREGDRWRMWYSAHDGSGSDGLHWTPILDRPGLLTPQHEAMTLYRFNGQYHVGGHQISHLRRLPMQEHPLGYYLGPRTFVVWRSPSLDRWPLEPGRGRGSSATEAADLRQPGPTAHRGEVQRH